MGRIHLLIAVMAAVAAGALSQNAPAPPKAPAANLSPGVPAVVRLVQVGLPSEMIVRAIEASGVTIQPTAEDLAALKQAGAPDEVVRAITAGRAGNPLSQDAALPEISLRKVRKIYVDKIPKDLDRYLLVEISRQLKDAVVVVLRPEDADALLVGKIDERTGVGAMVAGRVLGLQDTTTGIVSLVDKTRRISLWSSEAGDRTMPGGLMRGGPAKVAERLVRNLKAAMGL